MKRVLKIAVCLILTLITLCFTMGATCRKLYTDDPFPPPGLEWDGRFLYYPTSYGYSIVGTEPEFGVKSEVIYKLYLPSHYKGKPVDFDCTFYYGGSLHRFGLDTTSVKELFLNYELNGILSLRTTQCEKLYFPKTKIISDYWSAYTASPKLDFFVPAIMYEKYFEDILDIENISKVRILESNDYCIKFETIAQLQYLGKGRYIYKANTAYMFNYENSPNNDYYFINDFERGGLIENTPYEPYREGYTFTGWYKDSECTQKWDFELDTLPEPTYDGNGELEYVETRLYAGWNKI